MTLLVFFPSIVLHPNLVLANPYIILARLIGPPLNHHSQISKHTSSLIDSRDSNTNTLWEIFSKNPITTAQNLIPTIQLENKKYWLKRETKSLIYKKRRFFHTYKQYPTQTNLTRLNDINNITKKLIRRDYVAYIDNHICKNLKQGNSKPQNPYSN